MPTQPTPETNTSPNTESSWSPDEVETIGSPPPNIPTHDHRNFLYILITLMAVVIVGLTLYILFGSRLPSSTTSSEATISTTDTNPQTQAEEISTNPTSNWQTHSNASEGIEIKYPNSWTLVSLDGIDFGVLLDDKPFTLPEEAHYFAPITFSYNQITDTRTGQKSYAAATIEEGAARIIANYHPDSIEIESIIVGGQPAVQFSGTEVTGYLEGQFTINTLIQLDEKLLVANLGEKQYEDVYHQILSTVQFSNPDFLEYRNYTPPNFNANEYPNYLPTPTPLPDTTYTDSEYGYQITYTKANWQFRKTYGKDGISNASKSQDTILSGLDLHFPDIQYSSAVLVLNVLDAQGITDIETWIETYELNEPRYAPPQLTTHQGLKAVKYQFTPEGSIYQAGYALYFLKDNRVYRVYYQDHLTISPELQNIVNSITP